MDRRRKKSDENQRSKRSDGLKTRSLLLEEAGKIFAEKGYSDTTSKEICEAAGTNVAAVNYYFGNKDNLYEEVLIEAHKQLISLEDLEKISSTHSSPEEKLASLLTNLIQTAFSPTRHWGVRVVLRELSSPTGLVYGLISKSIIPKFTIVRQLISQIINYPPESPEVQRVQAFVMLPAISLILIPDVMRKKILPATTEHPDLILQDLIHYSQAGLAALSANTQGFSGTGAE